MCSVDLYDKVNILIIVKALYFIAVTLNSKQSCFSEEPTLPFSLLSYMITYIGTRNIIDVWTFILISLAPLLLFFLCKEDADESS